MGSALHKPDTSLGQTVRAGPHAVRLRERVDYITVKTLHIRT